MPDLTPNAGHGDLQKSWPLAPRPCPNARPDPERWTRAVLLREPRHVLRGQARDGLLFQFGFEHLERDFELLVVPGEGGGWQVVDFDIRRDTHAFDQPVA